MKKNWTKTRAPLPESEKIVGGGVSKKMLNSRKASFQKLFSKIK